MTIKETSIEFNYSIINTKKYTNKPLSTNTSPYTIRMVVRRAWNNGELFWRSKTQWYCFDQLVKHESSWNPWADNGRGWEETGGIPQSHPSRKMLSAGKDYKTNVWTQIRWMNGYIKSSYGSPCNAWSRWQSRAHSGSYGWY